jgi:5-methylcytosine-specific restriction enzyme subunit McrC
MNHHVLREYDTVVRGTTSGWSGANFTLEATAFDALAALVERDLPRKDLENLSGVASFTRVRGCQALKLRQWVGLIRLPDGTTLEVLPKTFERGDSLAECRALLMRMLAATDERFRVAPSADLNPTGMPLFEVFLAYALAGFRNALRRGVPHAYVAVREERAGLRGRLDLSRQLRQLPSRAHLLHVAYDEYVPNRAETRLVRSSLERIAKVTEVLDTKRGAREALLALNDVPNSRDVTADFAAWRLERGHAHFAPLEALCRLVLLELNPVVGGETVRALCVMFDMNKLYESYVAQLLRQRHPEWRIRTQAQERSLGAVARKPVFKLRPDLLIDLPDGEVIVADTKWKRLDASAPPPWGVTNGGGGGIAVVWGHLELESKVLESALLRTRIQIPVQRCPRDPQRRTNVLHGIPRVSIHRHRQRSSSFVQHLRTTTQTPTRSSRLQPRPRAFADEFPLELRDGSKDMKEQHAIGCRRVDVLLNALEANASSLQIVDALDQILQRPPQAIQFPHHERVALPCELERRLETFTLTRRAAGDISKDLGTTELLERIALQLELLILSADSSVPDEHGSRIPPLCRESHHRGCFRGVDFGMGFWTTPPSRNA